MSDLEDIKRRLYTPGGVPEPKPTFFDRLEKNPDETKRAWGEISETERRELPIMIKKKRRWHIGLVAVLLFLVGVLAIAGIFFFGFQKDSLAVTLLTKERVESGERVTYQIFYKNNGTQTLKDMELSFTYPQGAVPLKEDKQQAGAYRASLPLADLSSGEEAKVELEARLFGKQDEVKKATAVLLYRLESGSSRFSADATVLTTIVRVPLVVTVSMPNEVISGQKVDVVVDYSSNAEAAFDNMSLGIDYPQGFTFTKAEPAATIGNNIWKIGSIQPGDSGKIALHGTISGPPAEQKIFSVQMGVYDQATSRWAPYQVSAANSRISTPLLSVEQRINEARDAVVKPGDTLRFRLHYKNVLDIPLKNVRVEVELRGQVVDLQSLLIDSGAYDGTSQMVVWTPASFPTFASLSAQAEGDLSFQVRLKSNTSADLASGKNLTVESHARISSPDHPAGLEGVDLSAEDTISAKVSTRLVLSSRLLYQNQFLPNSGPLPPRVGKKTTYVAAWQVANSLNDLASVEVHATLLPGVSWENLFVPKDQSVVFDSGAGALVWRIGTVAAGSGISRNGPQLSFQIGLTPGSDQIDKSPTLVKDIQISGIDTFTGESVLVKTDELTTRLTSDSLTQDKDWRVVQ